MERGEVRDATKGKPAAVPRRPRRPRRPRGRHPSDSPFFCCLIHGPNGPWCKCEHQQQGSPKDCNNGYIRQDKCEWNPAPERVDCVENPSYPPLSAALLGGWCGVTPPLLLGLLFLAPLFSTTTDPGKLASPLCQAFQLETISA